MQKLKKIRVWWRSGLGLGLIAALGALGVARNGRTAARVTISLAGDPPSICPLKTPEQWQAFLKDVASEPNWVETCEDSHCDEKYVEHVHYDIQQTLRRCEPVLKRHPQLAACSANLRRFVPAWLRQHDNVSYGFNVPNREYFRLQETPDKPPGMMDPAPAIIAALPSRERVEAVARQAGLKYLTHDSALGGIRTFVLTSDPAGRWDQWLLLNLQTGDSQITESTPVSVLTVQKADAAGHPLPAVRLHFRDYFVSRLPNGKYKSELRLEANGKCFSCHANGVRQLIARRTETLQAEPVAGETDFSGNPVRSKPADFAFARLMEFNKRLRSYGSPDWDGKIDPHDFGPALGRTQGCVDCHDGKSRGILTVASSASQLKQKLIDELSMPPDTDGPARLERAEVHYPSALSPKELEDLDHVFAAHDKLANEYLQTRLPELKNWLLSVPCQ